MKQIRRKLLLILFSCFIILYILVIMFRKQFNDISCYNETSHPDGLIEFNYINEPEEPTLGKSIFFHETSCIENSELLLNSRQACAVESAAKMNPNRNVYLLYLNASKMSKSAEQMIQQLASYKNIKIRRIHIDKYMKNSPLEKWYASGILKTSQWPTSHLSDILRYLTLWKYGGIYLDLDVIVIKSLENLKSFAGAEDWEIVGSSVIGMGMENLGRRVADACVRDLKQNFKGDIWGYNGPELITRMLQNLCATNYTREMTPDRCDGFQVFSPTAFYPISYKNWMKYFETENMNQTMEIIKNSKVIHVWNKFSHERPIKVGSQVPYSIIAEKYCPKVYKNCDSFF